MSSRPLSAVEGEVDGALHDVVGVLRALQLVNTRWPRRCLRSRKLHERAAHAALEVRQCAVDGFRGRRIEVQPLFFDGFLPKTFIRSKIIICLTTNHGRRGGDSSILRRCRLSECYDDRHQHQLATGGAEIPELRVSKKIAALLAVPGATELLRAAGFEDTTDETGVAFLALTESDASRAREADAALAAPAQRRGREGTPDCAGGDAGGDISHGGSTVRGWRAAQRRPRERRPRQRRARVAEPPEAATSTRPRELRGHDREPRASPGIMAVCCIPGSDGGATTWCPPDATARWWFGAGGGGDERHGAPQVLRGHGMDEPNVTNALSPACRTPHHRR